MNADEQTKLLEDALKRIIEEYRNNPDVTRERLSQIAGEALEKAGIKT